MRQYAGPEAGEIQTVFETVLGPGLGPTVVGVGVVAGGVDALWKGIRESNDETAYRRSWPRHAERWDLPTEYADASVKALRARGVLTVPPGAPVSFAPEYDYLAWVVEVRIPIPGDVDWVHEYRVLVEA